MKHGMKIVPLMVLLVGLASCSLFRVDVETTTSGQLDIVVDDMTIKSTAAHPFYDWTTVDPGDDEDVAKYADQIVEVGVDGIFAEVESVNIPDVVFHVGSTFAIWDDADTAIWTMDHDWPIEEGTTLTLDDLGGTYDDVATILKKVEPFSIGMLGTSSHTGIFVTIRIDIESTITGSIF